MALLDSFNIAARQILNAVQNLTNVYDDSGEFFTGLYTLSEVSQIRELQKTRAVQAGTDVIVMHQENEGRSLQLRRLGTASVHR